MLKTAIPYILTKEEVYLICYFFPGKQLWVHKKSVVCASLIIFDTLLPSLFLGILIWKRISIEQTSSFIVLNLKHFRDSRFNLKVNTTRIAESIKKHAVPDFTLAWWKYISFPILIRNVHKFIGMQDPSLPNFMWINLIPFRH